LSMSNLRLARLVGYRYEKWRKRRQKKNSA
jgi:hypothetical protein